MLSSGGPLGYRLHGTRFAPPIPPYHSPLKGHHAARPNHGVLKDSPVGGANTVNAILNDHSSTPLAQLPDDPSKINTQTNTYILPGQSTLECRPEGSLLLTGMQTTFPLREQGEGHTIFPIGDRSDLVLLTQLSPGRCLMLSSGETTVPCFMNTGFAPPNTPYLQTPNTIINITIILQTNLIRTIPGIVGEHGQPDHDSRSFNLASNRPAADTLSIVVYYAPYSLSASPLRIALYSLSPRPLQPSSFNRVGTAADFKSRNPNTCRTHSALRPIALPFEFAAIGPPDRYDGGPRITNAIKRKTPNDQAKQLNLHHKIATPTSKVVNLLGITSTRRKIAPLERIPTCSTTASCPVTVLARRTLSWYFKRQHSQFNSNTETQRADMEKENPDLSSSSSSSSSSSDSGSNSEATHVNYFESPQSPDSGAGPADSGSTTTDGFVTAGESLEKEEEEGNWQLIRFSPPPKLTFYPPPRLIIFDPRYSGYRNMDYCLEREWRRLFDPNFMTPIIPLVKTRSKQAGQYQNPGTIDLRRKALHAKEAATGHGLLPYTSSPVGRL